MELGAAPLLVTGEVDGREVVKRALAFLQAAPLDSAYREALSAALRLPGNLLSAVPDLRWTRILRACCVAAGGRWEEAPPVAAAVEIFMAALDLLDDLEDGEAHPVASALGPARAMNVATGMLVLAHRRLLDAASARAAAALLDDVLRACAGQHADLAPPTGCAPDLYDALAITCAKSGSLAAALCRLGASLGGADGARQDLFARFGRHLGIAAQLANDIAALHPAAHGKTDVALGRPTLPLAYAARLRAHASGRAIELWLGGPAQYAWVVAETNRRFALDLIPDLAADAAALADLAALLRLL